MDDDDYAVTHGGYPLCSKDNCSSRVAYKDGGVPEVDIRSAPKTTATPPSAGDVRDLAPQTAATPPSATSTGGSRGARQM